MSQFAAESADDATIAALFAEFDIDGGGSISANEFQQVAYLCGEVLSDKETAAIVKVLDADNNGTIDLNEFKTWLNGFDGSKESDPLAMAKSSLLRAKIFGKIMEKNLRTASAKASDIVKFDPTATTPVSVSLQLQLGKDEDIKMGATLKLESLSQEEKSNIGGGISGQAKIDVVIACKEGTTDMQVGKLAGRISTLYEIAMEKLGPMIAQFGALTVAPTDCHDGRKGVLLSFVSPNNAVQMMVPAEALPMDFSTLLQSFEVSLGLSFDFNDVITLDRDAFRKAFEKALSLSVTGEINKEALKHGREVAAAMMRAEAEMMGAGADDPFQSDPVKAIGLLANLARANASIEFDSFADLLDLLSLQPSYHVSALKSLKRELAGVAKHEMTTTGWCAALGMGLAQIRDSYADIQSCVGGIASVTAATTLGVRATLTLKNFNIFCIYPSLQDIDAWVEPEKPAWVKPEEPEEVWDEQVPLFN